MLREESVLLVRIHQLLDICLTVSAFIAAYFLKRYLPAPFGGLITEPNYYVVLLLIIIIWYITFRLGNLYESYRKQTLERILWQMIKAVLIGMSILLICLYLLKIKDVSRLLLGLFCLFDIVLLGLSKSFTYKILASYRNKGFNYRNILIFGSKKRALDIIGTIEQHAYSGYRVLGCLDVDNALVGKELKKGIRVIGLIENLRDVLKNEIVDEIIIAMPMRIIDEPHQAMIAAEELGIPIRIVPDWQIDKLLYKPKIAKVTFEEFLGYPTMAMATTSPLKDKLLIKYLIDYVFAGILTILLLPVFAVIAAAIKIFSTGPVFYRQQRSGLNGRKFVLYKFRTMTIDAEGKHRQLSALNESDGPVFKIKNDPRIIPYIGTFLRKTSLDELPQLINILRGEMSLVGPRPPIPAEVEQYNDWQRRRLSMKPGLTCIWQTTPRRNEISFNDWMKMDLEYIDNWSLNLDFRILLKTLVVVLLGWGR
jgi:exopolysaccharide biosynthesis polyprenyl glycosylphosphotransferase